MPKVKNLARFKEKVNARNIMVQAMYQLSFGHNTAKEIEDSFVKEFTKTKVDYICLLYTSPSPRDKRQSRMPSSA